MYTPINVNFSRKFGSNRWISKSIKVNRDVHLSSDLEYANWLYVECNPTIINFCEQPFEIRVPINNVVYTSIPDMWILYSNGVEEIREVKYYKDLSEPRVKRQIEVQKKYCKSKDIVHRIITEKDIKSNTYLLSNYKQIIKILKNETKYDKNLQQIILKSLSKQDFTVNTLTHEIESNFENVLFNVASLIYTGEIYANIDSKYFGKNTEVYLK